MCSLLPQLFDSKSMFSISVRPRKTVRGKHGVIPPAARPGRRPGKKPHPARKSRPKVPPVDDAEVEELVSDFSPSLQPPPSPASVQQVEASPWRPPPQLCRLLRVADGWAWRQQALREQLCPAFPCCSLQISSPLVNRQPVTC